MASGKLLGKVTGNCYRVLCMLATPTTAKDIEENLGIKGNGRGRAYITGIEKWCPELKDRLRTEVRKDPDKVGRPAQTWYIDYLGEEKPRPE